MKQPFPQPLPRDMMYIMYTNVKKVTMASTQARKHFFELIDAAKHEGQITEIEKNGQVVARILPPEKREVDWDAHLENFKKLADMLTEEDFQQMENARKEGNESRFPDW